MRQSNSKTTIGAGATEGFTQRAGLPVQPGLIQSVALDLIRETIKPVLASVARGEEIKPHA